MEKNKQSEYSCIRKEKIEKIVKEVYENKSVKDREFKFHIYLGSQETIDNWNEQFNKALKEEIKNWNNESEDNVK